MENNVSGAITRINPHTLPDAREMGYSQISIVESGRIAYVSGQVAWQPGGQAVPDDLAQQAEIATANAKAALDALGATSEHIAIARCYVTDLTPERLTQVMPSLLKLFDGAQPSLTGIGVAALAAPDLQIELELTVRVPD